MLRVFCSIAMLAGAFSAAAEATCLTDPTASQAVCQPADIFVYLDQKSVVAGEGSILVVAELVTVTGTSPADDSLVHFFARNGEDVSRRIAFTEAGIARARMPVGDRAGPVEIWAEARDIRAVTQWLNIVPDAPLAFSIDVTGCGPDRLCMIEAKDLQDQYGNMLPDGMQGTMTTHVQGVLVAQQSIYTVRGTILTPWQRPDIEAKVSLSLAGTRADLWVAP